MFQFLKGTIRPIPCLHMDMKRKVSIPQRYDTTEDDILFESVNERRFQFLKGTIRQAIYDENDNILFEVSIPQRYDTTYHTGTKKPYASTSFNSSKVRYDKFMSFGIEYVQIVSIPQRYDTTVYLLNGSRRSLKAFQFLKGTIRQTKIL